MDWTMSLKTSAVNTVMNYSGLPLIEKISRKIITVQWVTVWVGSLSNMANMPNMPNTRALWPWSSDMSRGRVRLCPSGILHKDSFSQWCLINIFKRSPGIIHAYGKVVWNKIHILWQDMKNLNIKYFLFLLAFPLPTTAYCISALCIEPPPGQKYLLSQHQQDNT